MSGTVADVGKWFVLFCRECDPDTPIPFETAEARGRWASAHTAGTGHDRWLVTEEPREAEASSPHARPSDDAWPLDQDVFWRTVKSFLPAGTVLVVKPSPLGPLEVEAWRDGMPDDVVARRWAVPPAVVEDSPQASNLGRQMAAALMPSE